MKEQKPNVYSVFCKELSLIEDTLILDFVIKAFENFCPDYFWYIPASVRGHHSPICRTRGGLVHHVKMAVSLSDQFLDAANIDDADPRHSQTIAGVLLHDMMKRGPVEDELVTFPDHRTANKSHGRYCAAQLQLNMYIPPEVEPVIKAVQLHMGRWTQDVTDLELAWLATDEVVRTTHLADYMASRALHQLLDERHTDESMGYLNDYRGKE